MARSEKQPPAAKTDAIGSRRKPDRTAGRPPTPTPDPRLEAAKAWSTAARQAARDAFEAAISRGATRDEAIDAGHEAGLRRNLEERGASPAAVGLVLSASKIFGASKVVVVPPGKPRSRREERCFDELFSQHGFPDPKPAKSPAQPVRNDSDNEDQKTATEALADGLSKASLAPRQGDLAFDRRTA
jgi:hypothetical protein